LPNLYRFFGSLRIDGMGELAADPRRPVERRNRSLQRETPRERLARRAERLIPRPCGFDPARAGENAKDFLGDWQG
jgi:hypothetical protein